MCTNDITATTAYFEYIKYMGFLANTSHLLDGDS